MKKVAIFVILGCLLFASNVSAKSYYENELGVKLTQAEYEFFSELYWDGYQNYLSVDEYEQIRDMNLFYLPIEKQFYTNYELTRGSTVTSNLRTLSISKVCSSSCYITLVTQWIGNPFVKSYDVFGARLNGPTLLSVNNALVTGDGYTKAYNNPQQFGNGFGYSILLPNTGNLKVSASFTTTNGGTIYGSYQHAVSNTTELVSKQYSIGLGGYGNVFNFYGTARTIYDNATGVDIAV